MERGTCARDQLFTLEHCLDPRFQPDLLLVPTLFPELLFGFRLSLALVLLFFELVRPQKRQRCENVAVFLVVRLTGSVNGSSVECAASDSLA